jgi:hypothetical protein
MPGRAQEAVKQQARLAQDLFRFSAVTEEPKCLGLAPEAPCTEHCWNSDSTSQTALSPPSTSPRPRGSRCWAGWLTGSSRGALHARYGAGGGVLCTGALLAQLRVRLLMALETATAYPSGHRGEPSGIDRSAASAAGDGATLVAFPEYDTHEKKIVDASFRRLPSRWTGRYAGWSAGRGCRGRTRRSSGWP